jgi:predicted AAA+ superfamily ATPase
MYIRRTLESFIQKASEQFPVVLVSGPRQVGKTTILRHMSQSGRNYVTLDDPLLAQLARDEPSLFLQRFKPPILIDEIQYAPGLLPYIKMMVDSDRKNGMFWLTGSQQFQLMQGLTESLAGRVGIVNLLGLSLKESQEEAQIGIPFLPDQKQLEQRLRSSPKLSLNEIYKIIWRGSFPIMALNKEIDRDLYYGSYIQTYLQRDVRNLANVGNEGTFLKFLRASAARTGQMLNLSDLARDVAISVPTAKYWLSILESSSIVYLLEPYHTNTAKRLIKSPKLYFLDTGLCSYLTQWSTPETLESGAMSGAILETFIFTEILKSYWHNGKQAPLYYYRDKDKKEIDLLIIQDDKIYPLEFKSTASPNRMMVNSFQLLEKLNLSVQKGGIICLADTLLPITAFCDAIPVWLL